MCLPIEFRKHPQGEHTGSPLQRKIKKVCHAERVSASLNLWFSQPLGMLKPISA